MSIINIDESKCVGCNSCVRVCPADAANTAKLDADGRVVITINDNMCIKCGACIKACNHNARYFLDDTDAFMEDVEAGRETALIVAPAIKMAFAEDWSDLLAYFRKRGTKLIYDVSFGADVCTWVHLRYVAENPNAKIISQPCAAIVNYILKHNHNLIKYLSPGQSPMMCTAIYMRKYEHFKGKIAAISPCIAKKDEFKQNNYVINYNVTLEKLAEYLKAHNVNYRGAAGGREFTFDSPASYVGAIYPQPGGLKVNLLLHKPDLMVVNSEGTGHIYENLDQFATTRDSYRPTVYDVLNCEYGCNGGPALGLEYDPFKMATLNHQIKTSTNKDRVSSSKLKLTEDAQFARFDKELNLNDFLRSYVSENTGYKAPTAEEIRKGLTILRKTTETECHFDCHACGYKSCEQMAGAIVRGQNVPENCRRYESGNLERVNNEVRNIAAEIASIIDKLAESVSAVEQQAKDIKKGGNETSEQMGIVADYMGEINNLTNNILSSMKDIDGDIGEYSKMTNSVKAIAGKINLLSLNASIESARAGEAGRAFAVVAANIRELSDSSKQSVEHAQDSEDSIRGSITSVNETVGEFGKQVEGLTARITDARAKVEAVTEGSNAITEAMTSVGEIASRLEMIAQKAGDLLK